MELKAAGKKLLSLLKKYKFACLILVIGICLMMLPTGTKSSSKTTAVSNKDVINTSIEEQLTIVLREISGVGKVCVLITTGEGEETIYQTDSDRSGTAENAGRSSTVVITDGNRGQTGLVRQINPPTYLGAIIVCQGADDPVVRLSVIDAVSKATGLKANNISVLKMK